MNTIIKTPNRNFFEWISLSARETVFTAAIGWLLDEDSPLTLEHRVRIVSSLSPRQCFQGVKTIRAETEKEKIDLLLTIECESETVIVALENKIKVTESDGQLASYDRYLKGLEGRENPPSVRKVFLTVSGEAPTSRQNWERATYDQLLSLLEEVPADNSIVTDICAAIRRIVALADKVRSNDSTVVAAAFNEEIDAQDSIDWQYIKAMRYQKVLQRVWMTELAKTLDVDEPWTQDVSESHGQAILDLRRVLAKPQGFSIGLQIQSRKVKLFCEPNPYGARATAIQRSTVEATLKTICSRMNLTLKLSISRGLGFSSLTLGTLPPHDLNKWRELISEHFQGLRNIVESLG